jgi:hypothetical protein
MRQFRRSLRGSALVWFALAGCAGGSSGMSHGAGAAGDGALASGGSSAPFSSGAAGAAPVSGSGGSSHVLAGAGGVSAPANVRGGSGGGGAAGSGGAAARSGSGGQGTGGAHADAGSGGSGGSAGGSGGSGDDAGVPDDPIFSLDPDAGLFDPGTNTNAQTGMCADAFCFDIFDCTIFHPDLVGVCTFTDCDNGVCI